MVMSLTGLFLLLFVTFHVLMNVVALISGDAYNAVCEFLGANWYALVGTAVLAAGFVVHIIYAFWLSLLNRKARGNDRYAVTDKKKGVTWESENMLVLGFIILGFVCLHLYNFWFKMQFAELSGIETGAFDPQNGAAYVKELFTTSLWGQIYCVLYLLWLVVLWLHLNHGVGSAMTSMGLNNLKWQKRVEVISTVVATLVVLPFTIVVLYYLGMGIGMLCA